MQKIIFLDTETTGTGPDDFICQLAYKTGDEIFCELFKPPVPISIEASSVTHISNKMVKDKPAFKESEHYKMLKNMLEDTNTIFVAHNAKFDIGMIEKEGITPAHTICTLRVARYLDKEHKIPQHKLQYLRYYLEIEIEAQAHDALGDVMVLEQLFARLYKKIKEEIDPNTDPLRTSSDSPLAGGEDPVLQKMIEISSKPSLMYKFSFGKHSGKTVAEVASIDRSYLEWFLATKEKDSPDDEDWIYTLKYYLGKLV